MIGKINNVSSARLEKKELNMDRSSMQRENISEFLQKWEIFLASMVYAFRTVMGGGLMISSLLLSFSCLIRALNEYSASILRLCWNT